MYTKLLTFKEQVILHLERLQGEIDHFLFLEIIKCVDDTTELKEILVLLKSQNPEFYEKTEELIKELITTRDFIIESALDNKIRKQISDAKDSLNTGDYLCYLIGKKVILDKIFIDFQTIIPFFKTTIAILNLEIKRYSELLKIQFESHLIIPFEYALHCFLIYDKNLGLKKFKKILIDDAKNRRISETKYEYLVNRDLFFGRLNLDFIPLVSQGEIDLNKNNISKKEINKIIDSGDIFNKSYPLDDLEPKDLLNPKNIKDEQEILSILGKFFAKDFNFNNHKNLDCPKIFLETISNPYPIYSLENLQDVRDMILLEMKDKYKKENFLALLYNFRIKEFIDDSTKLQIIMSSYIGGEGSSIDNMITQIIRESNISKRIEKSRIEIERNYFN